MKILLLRRVVSVWLCVAVVCWYSSCYVGCAEPHQEVQRPVSSQDVGPEEESGENIHHHKEEESWVAPAQLPSEHEQLTESVRQKEEPTIQEAFELEEATVEEESEASKADSQPEPEEHEQNTQNQQPETSISPDQEQVASPQPSPDPISGVPAEPKDDSDALNLQNNIQTSVSDDASEPAAPEVIDSDFPPDDCDEEDNPYDSDSNPPMVLDNISNVHTAGTKTDVEPPLSPASGHGTQHLEANASHMVTEQDLSSPAATDTDPSVSSKDPEDIPTFDEWKRKVMEVEKEKTQSTHTSNNGAPHTVKKVQKNYNNYASVECGAKILGANQEAKTTSSILEENMDMYMLNPCSNKIWFIIELCEPIQLKQLDIANFELFSSTPKDFLVSISDRYPTNKWLKLGTFHARDERTVQSFPLDEQVYAKYVKMFAKYIKVELVSHFGSEHFCPLSLIRVFGTSMVEEYEEIADPSERPDDQDDDLDYPPGYAAGEDKSSNNLIGTATDVILNMVNNIAVNVLGGGEQGNLSSQEVNVTDPSTQLEITTQSITTDFTLVPSPEEKEVSPDPEAAVTEAPSSETPGTETPTDDTSRQELPLVEEGIVTPPQGIVTPLEKEEEDHISSSITLLDKEEEADEEKHKSDQDKLLHHCSVLSSLSSSCSCALSLQEYLRRQCSALLSKKRRCQATDRKQTIPPVQTPSWQLPLLPSSCPEPQPHHSHVPPPHQQEQEPDKEQAPEPETENSGAGPSETAQPPENPTEPQKESVSEPPLPPPLPQLEPSQTSSLPTKPSATDSSPAQATPIVKVETPQMSSEEPHGELKPEHTQDVPSYSEEKHIHPTASLAHPTYIQPSVCATEEKPSVDIPQPEEIMPDKTDQSQVPHPTSSHHLENQPDPPVLPESGTVSTEESHGGQDDVAEPEPLEVIPDGKMEDFAEDFSTQAAGSDQTFRPTPPVPPPPPPSSSSSAPASPSDIYAEQPNGTEHSGSPVHGSSQKESVFMRLNNRIKALEMNMSLSGRYLEQLSQRYRKQMDEMQRAFNITIIKLQNTSRIAEEQDQRQTESIQSLQGQLENMTQLVVNLSVRVGELQEEVADRQNYLLLSLVLCLCLALMCVNHCRGSTLTESTEPEAPVPKNYTYCCPERQFSSGDETGLKRSVSYPLIHSDSFQLANNEDPERIHAEETQSLCPTKKKRRRKMKPVERVETLKPCFHAAPDLGNGSVLCNGAPVITHPTAFTKRLLQPLFRDSPSELSSEGSSHSDDPSFCGITTVCNRICDGLPPPKTRAEKRALRRRRPKSSCVVGDFFQPPKRDEEEQLPISTIEGIMNSRKEQSSGTFGVNVALSGPV